MAPRPTQIHSFSMHLSRLSISRVYSLHAPPWPSWEHNHPPGSVIKLPGKLQPSREGHNIPTNAVALPGWSAPSHEHCSLPGNLITLPGG